MSKPSNTRWILFLALVTMWILMIQIVPRFLPFNFRRVFFIGIPIHTDYLIHVLLFIAIMVIIDLLHLKIKLRYLFPLMLVVATIAEVIQLYIPKRTFNYWDLGSNVAGVIIGAVIVWVARMAVFRRLR